MLRKIEIGSVNADNSVFLSPMTDPCSVDLREPIVVGSGQLFLGELPLQIKDGKVTFENDEMNYVACIPPIPPREAGTMFMKVQYDWIQRVLVSLRFLNSANPFSRSHHLQISEVLLSSFSQFHSFTGMRCT